jgi:Mg2+ and Co2+ transporter CorA
MLLICIQYFDDAQISEQKQLKMAVEELIAATKEVSEATKKVIAATKALTDETTAHKVVGERMEESGKCMTFLTMIAIIFLPLQLSATVSPSASLPYSAILSNK